MEESDFYTLENTDRVGIFLICIKNKQGELSGDIVTFYLKEPVAFTGILDLGLKIDTLCAKFQRPIDVYKRQVLKRNGYTVSFVYRDSATGGTVNGAPASTPLSYAGGDAVEVNAPAAITGYSLTGVTIDQGTGGTLSAQADAGAVDFGKVQPHVGVFQGTRL